MADNAEIGLLGFAGFRASERFLRALDDEIWVSRWENPPKIRVERPEGLDSGDAMKAELERPSLVTVLSVHAYFCDGCFLGFCGEGDQPPVLLTESLEILGASSMLLIDACEAHDVFAELESHARPGSLIAGLDYGPGHDQLTQGRDSVTALGAVIRELCYPARKDLSAAAAARAVTSVNAQIGARNDAERKRGVTSKNAGRPLLRMHQC
ncbi:MAG: hypothetical protein WBQ71_30130 [Trebonia sp.]